MACQQRPPLGRMVRAAALTALAVSAAVVTWRLRPSAGVAATPDSAVVTGCAWLAWVLVGYLALAIAVTALSHLAAGLGFASRALPRLAPAGVRRLVDTVVTLSAASAVLGGSATIATAAPVAHHAVSAFDWPGLASSGTAPRHHPARPPRQHRHRHQHLAGGFEGAEPVVVQPGESLWSIAADHLGPAASDAAVTAAWHAWYAANRGVIGPDPSVIQPGQQLVPPAAHPDR
jgi:hypothetical protein